MFNETQIFAVAVSVIGALYVFHLVASGRLELKYSLMWLILAILVFIVAIFPQPLFAIGYYLGFEVPANFVFFIGLAMTLCIVLSLSVIVSWQSKYIRDLVQQVALLRARIGDIERSAPKEQSSKR